MREKYIDIMRGVSMLAIISVHLPQEYIIIKYGLSFMVPTFFVLSGFFLPINENESLRSSLKGWYNKKGKRLILSYFGLSFWSILITSGVALVKGVFSLSSIVSLIYQTISGLGILTLWFLPALIIGEIIIIVLRKSYARRCVIIGVLTLAVLMFSNKMSLKGIFGQACYNYANPIYMICINALIVISQGILASFFINAGKSINEFLNEIKECKVSFLIILGCVLEVIQILISKKMVADIHYMNMTTPIRFVVAAILGVLAIAIFSIVFEKYNRGIALAYIGKNSLFFMGTHHNFMLTNLVGFLMCRTGLNYVLSPVLKFLIALGLLLFLDLMLLKLFNRHKLTRYLFFDIRRGRYGKES